MPKKVSKLRTRSPLRLLILAGAFAVSNTLIIAFKVTIVKNCHWLEVSSLNTLCTNVDKMAPIFSTFLLFASTNSRSNTEFMTMLVQSVNRRKKILSVNKHKNKKIAEGKNLPKNRRNCSSRPVKRCWTKVYLGDPNQNSMSSICKDKNKI